MAGIRLLFTHNAALGVFQEADDVLDLRTIGHLVANLFDDIENARLTVEEQTIGIGDVALNLLVDLGIVHHRRVGTAILHRITTSNDVGRHVVREGRACLNQREVSGTGVGILNGTRGEDDTIADLAVAGNLRTITEHAVVAHHRIVADVGSFEQEVMATDLRHAVAVGTTVDDDILADDVVVADLHIRLSATEVEVLRQGSDDGALMDLVALTDARAVADGDEGEDDAVVTDLHVVLDIHEGEYLTVVADLRLGRNLGFWTYFTHIYNIFFLCGDKSTNKC